MTDRTSTSDWILRQRARKLGVDEAVEELERSQKAMNESERLRRVEKAKGVHSDMLFAAVPVGEENAETSIEI